ncbi:MAG: HDOD domain-containing protein [Deltaproteobacteria bacterium]|nr:HDOD domain-containing protein [Deltaproteobacteria bacterium]
MTETDKKTTQTGKLEVTQKINFLKKIEFFANFDDQELRQLLAVTKWLRVQKGEYIIKENTMERAFYILIKGEVSVIKTVDKAQKKAVELTVLTAGACFGEMSLVTDVKRTAGVVTRNKCFILLVEPKIINSSNVFLQLKFYKRFCEILVARLIKSNAKLTNQDKTVEFRDLREIDLPSGAISRDTDHNTINKAKSPAGKKYADLQRDIVLPRLPAKKDRIIKRQLQRRLRSALELPVNPVVKAAIRPLITNKSDNTRLFADYIHLDPVLSCKVLQIANSSYFRRTTPVCTVPHAMITVGINQIQEAMADTIETSTGKPAFSGFTQVASLFWRHSVIVARITAMLTETIRLSTSSDVYLAGLLHDIGILGLDCLEPDFYPHLLDQKSEVFNDMLATEVACIGTDHGQAGAWIGESTGMPEVYLDVIKMHHSPHNARANGLTTALVHLADLFASRHGGGFEYLDSKKIDISGSGGWIIIQEQHRPFIEVNIPDFINKFDNELETTWGSITADLNF